MEVHVNTESDSLTFNEFEDQASIDYRFDQGTSDNYSLCGSRTYSLVDVNGDPASNTLPVLSLNDKTI